MLLKKLVAACGLALLALAPAVAADTITPTKSGAIIETDRYKVEFHEGYLRSIINKLTGEEYLDTTVAPEKFMPNLPAGFGTQAGKEAFAASGKLYHWPWFEHSYKAYWPNQHYADAKAKFTFAARGEKACTLSYEGLGDGKLEFNDEKFGLDIEIDEKTGDLLVTPWGKSSRPGVYSANLNVAPLAPAVTAEAPIFDGIRLDRNMTHTLWSNAWGGYWDYAFVAFNGYKRGAVAIWTQDAELKYYKSLFYLINPEGLSFSFSYMNIPPFDKLTESRAATPWRLQAFDKSWSQGAARFREWRLANVKIAPRPEWTKHISYVTLIHVGSKQYLDRLSKFFDNNKELLGRVANFAATVRKAKFDTQHYDNTPYDDYKADMVGWKASGAKFMSYLQPMIMWGAPAKDAKAEFQETWKQHVDADTHSAFQDDPDKVLPYIDQHHLGHQKYQRWFLDWVKAYIQENGAAGVYHDQSYHCPIDIRGLIAKLGNMTTTQGMADYFYKAATESPDSIHATEHMTEVNNVGASLGIAGGILWGTSQSMRMQRIKHGSCISASLSYPNGALFAFPHYSDVKHGNALRFEQGQDLMEMRAELAGGEMPGGLFARETFDQLPYFRNHRWIDNKRIQTFVRVGLRPEFPEDFDRGVRSYFKGAKGEDFRYVNYPWGSALVEFDAAGKEKAMHYGRIHGVHEAKTKGAIYGWAMYNAEGPAGLHPERYYPLDPKAERPQIWFSTANNFSDGLYEAYVEDCFGTSNLAWAVMRPGPRGVIVGADSICINAPKKPTKVLVDGLDVTKTIKEITPTSWKVDFRFADPLATVTVLAVLDAPQGGLGEEFQKNLLCRSTLRDDSLDELDPEYVKQLIKFTTPKKGKEILENALEIVAPVLVSQFNFLLAPPAGAKLPGHYAIERSFGKTPETMGYFVNGKVVMGNEIAFKEPGEYAFVSTRGNAGVKKISLVWVEDETPAPAQAVK